MARRMSFWDDSLMSITVGSGSTNISVLSSVPGGQSEGFTLVRCLVHLSFQEGAIPSVNGGQAVAAGIGLATKEAIALGATALPDPNTNTEQPIGDWVWRQRVYVAYDNTNVVQPAVIDKDVRSARKLAGGQLYLSVRSVPVFGTAQTIRVIGLVRCLILRP